MLIILDRDGVINEESSAYIKSPEEWIPISGSLEKIVEFKRQGHQVVVVTNQSGVGRGLLDEVTLLAIHEKFKRELKILGGQIDAIFFCPHHPEDGCECRKPKPGLLLKAAQQFHVDIKEAWFIGDSMSDIQAARMAGCGAILVKTGKGIETLQNLPDLEGILVFDDLKHVSFS